MYSRNLSMLLFLILSVCAFGSTEAQVIGPNTISVRIERHIFGSGDTGVEAVQSYHQQRDALCDLVEIAALLTGTEATCTTLSTSPFPIAISRGGGWIFGGTIEIVVTGTPADVGGFQNIIQ